MERFNSFLNFFLKCLVQVACAVVAIALGLYILIMAPGVILRLMGIIPISAVFAMLYWWETYGKYM